MKLGKILIVHNSYQQYGGEDAVVQAELSLLRDKGNDVRLFTVSNDSIKKLNSKIKIALASNYSLNSKQLLSNQLHNYKPDIVHVHNTFPILTPSIYDACKENEIPVVQTLHNYRLICPGALLMRDGQICEDCIEGSAYNAILHRCYRNSIIGSYIVARIVQTHKLRKTWENKVNKFIVLTKFSKDKFIQAGFPSDKIAIKPNFISSIPYLKEKFNNNFGLFVGRISHEKGINTLLNAWEKINVPLHVIGDGPLSNIFNNNQNEYIQYFGYKPQEFVKKEMENASFLVMPSDWYEGFPMVIVEAFANGLPVIVSKLGAMKEIVEDGLTGLHFEPGNWSDLANKVQWMLEHPSDCNKMGENARSTYLNKYTPDKNYDLLLSVYKDAIADYEQ